VDDDHNHRHEHSKMQRLPIGLAAAPSPPAGQNCGVQDPYEGNDAEQAGLGPEVQEDVMRIDEAIGVLRVPIRSKLLRESR